MSEGTVLVPNTAGGFPVDGVGVTAAAALTAGQAIRQIAAIGDARAIILDSTLSL